jgi:threonine dehydrogenase-like Zn-dependent dehydrogenase
MGSPELSLRAFEVSVAERSLIGTFTYAAGDFRDAVTYLSELDRSVLDALVSRIVSLSDAQDEFTALGRNDGPAGKVLVRLAAE